LQQACAPHTASGAHGIDVSSHAPGHRRADGTGDVVLLDHFRVGRVERSMATANVIISPVAHRPSLERMEIEVHDTLNEGSFTAAQRHFLEDHRDMVLLRSAGQAALIWTTTFRVGNAEKWNPDANRESYLIYGERYGIATPEVGLVCHRSSDPDYRLVGFSPRKALDQPES
jgi:hypothetical protein